MKKILTCAFVLALAVGCSDEADNITPATQSSKVVATDGEDYIDEDWMYSRVGATDGDGYIDMDYEDIN